VRFRQVRGQPAQHVAWSDIQGTRPVKRRVQPSTGGVRGDAMVQVDSFGAVGRNRREV